ncbi:PAC2 family protein [uncultured archaeon]|nr:PAC2 family protein [uncultured archaeon]
MIDMAKRSESERASYFPPKDGVRTNFEIIAPIGRLVDPILIEGLPGIGFVGKLAAEHVVDDLGAKKVATLYSHHFPHQILINKDGTIKMLTNELYIYKDPKKRNDLVILTGDVQPTTSKSQYEVMNIILDFFADTGGSRIITLGGYGMGKLVEKPRVFGAVTDKKDIDAYRKHGVSFGEVEGSIIGAAGMLLGLGRLKGMNGICLMGETHGNYIDHKSAQRVIEVLSSIVGMKINTDKLGKKAKESEGMIKKLEEELAKGETAQPIEMPKKKEDLSYIR